MKVPLLDLKPQNDPLLPELRAAFERVLLSNQFILGPDVERFEQSCAQVAGARHAIGVSSGTDAILLALMALDIRPDDEVLSPSFTFFATAGCIARTGACPVFVDSCPVCLNMDVADARKRITKHTKAIMPVHIFGQMADMDAILALGKEHGLPVIEDAAQAIGACSKGRPAGSLGDFGTFSFFPSKNLGGYGDAGMLVTNNDALAEKARLLRNHGAQPKYYHRMVGGNFRIDTVQAALLNVKIGHLENYTAGRRSNAAFYNAQLSKLPGVVENARERCCEAGVNPADPSTRLVLPVERSGNKHIYNQYTILVKHGQRDKLREFLQSRNIGSEIYYPVPLHRQECFQVAGYTQPSLPVCEQASGECLSIPVFAELTPEQRDAVVSAIGDFLKETTNSD